MPAKRKEAELAIFNCHIHTFTRKNVPDYLTRIQLGWLGGTLVGWLERSKILFKWITSLISRLLPGKNDMVARLARFAETSDLNSQEVVFRRVQKQYPKGTRFIILPMNLHYLGDLGEVKEPIEKQLAGLLDLADKVNREGNTNGYGRIIHPFYTIHPKQPDFEKELKKIEQGEIFVNNNDKDKGKKQEEKKFWGLKIYPNLGYMPNDLQMDRVYKYCEQYNVPVMTHCTPTGLWSMDMKDERKRREYSQPQNYIQIMNEHPDLRICLAHFGGAEEWIRHLKQKDESSEEEAWVKTIYEILKDDKKYPNLYADISYTVFTPKIKDSYIDLIDYLKVMLNSNKKVREHVLFGSDYYMVEQEKLSEKEVSILLRSRLGEDLFFQIAHENPKRFLGIK